MFSTYLNIFSIQKIIIPLQSYMLPNDMPMLIFVLNQIWVLSLEDDPKLCSVFVRGLVVDITKLPIQK